MTKRELKISALKKQASLINFADYLTKEDKDTLKEIDNEIAKLEKKGRKGWLIKITNKSKEDDKWTYHYYLTNDDILCCSKDKTYYQTKKEAQERLARYKLKEDKFYKMIAEICKK